MDEKTDLTVKIGKALAARSSRRGFLRFAGMAVVGLGAGLHGASLAWASGCAGCGGADCGCTQYPGTCCLEYPQGSCDNIGYSCTSTGCHSGCTQNSWSCCAECCNYTCAECCCDHGTLGCSCAIKYNTSCGGCNCPSVLDGAAA